MGQKNANRNLVRQHRYGYDAPKRGVDSGAFGQRTLAVLRVGSKTR